MTGLKDCIDGALAIHPLADLIPGMTDSDYAELRDDIATHGLGQPIVLFEHMILDGRHRARACQETGTEMRFVNYGGDEPASYVLSLNLHRRHLSVSQRAMIATDFLPHLAVEAKSRQGTRTDLDPTLRRDQRNVGRDHSKDSRAVAGSLVGVGHDSVSKAKRVVADAPELAERVRAGDMTVNTAYGIVKRRESAEPEPENGRFASGRSVQRIAVMAGALAMAVNAIPLNKSCARLTDDERAEALQSCKQGLKALNALANSLGR